MSGLDPDSAQGDRAISDILRMMGADVTANENTVSVSYSSMLSIEIDAKDIPDAVPVIAAVCAAANGTSIIRGTRRLRYKESDRVESVCAMIRALGGDCSDEEDAIVIKGGKLTGGVCDSYGDHRIAMAAAVASTFCTPEVTVLGAQVVAKSYPGFWDTFRMLGGKFEITGQGVF